MAGTQLATRGEVKELAARIQVMMPGAKNAPEGVRLAVAQMALMHGLDPFSTEIIPLETKRGWVPYVGILGMRRAASQQGNYERVLVPLTDRWAGEFYGATAVELRQACGFTDKDIAWICAIYRQGVEQRPFVELGVVGPAFPYAGTSPIFKMAGVRAERAALRAAFNLPFPDVGNGDTGRADVVDGEVIVPPSTSVGSPAQPNESGPGEWEDDDLIGEDELADDSPEPEPESEPEQPSEAAFVHRVLTEIPYYQHALHVRNTMAKFRWIWSAPKEDALLYQLNCYANQRANEKAAAQAPEGAML